MHAIDFDEGDPVAIREAYVKAYYECFGATTALDESILARFDAEKREPTVEDVKALYALAEGLGRILDRME